MSDGLTFAQLLELWRDRDARYMRAGRDLTRSELEIVRAHRERESARLRGSLLDLSDAWSVAHRWDPPER